MNDSRSTPSYPKDHEGLLDELERRGGAYSRGCGTDNDESGMLITPVTESTTGPAGVGKHWAPVTPGTYRP